MPAFTADYVGSKNVGPIYGLMLTAWDFASYFGPQLLVKIFGQADRTSGLHTTAIIMLISTVPLIIVSPPMRMTR
jgi:MFS transporter, OFA family, oxalate/formate antiporter